MTLSGQGGNQSAFSRRFGSGTPVSGNQNQVHRPITPRIKVITAATKEPVTVAECQSYLKIDDNADNDVIEGMIGASRKFCETYTHRKFVTQTLEAWYDIIPYTDVLNLLFAPTTEVTDIKYYGTDNAVNTFSSSSYETDLVTEPARIYLNQSSNWPTSLRNRNALVVKYVVGWADAESVPNGIKEAIKLIVADLYESRGERVVANERMEISETVPKAALLLLEPYALEDL